MDHNTSSPSIFEYNDFRRFLADSQEARERIDATFSKSGLSRMLGLPNTRSYFTDVLRGKPVSPIFTERFIKVLGLSADEARFFRILVKFNQATNIEEREIYFDQLIALNRTPKRILERKLFTYYSNWYHSVIRALLNILDFSDDYDSLAKAVFPPITRKKAVASIRLLLDLKLISRNKRGFYKPTESSISTPDFMRDAVVTEYQTALLQRACENLHREGTLPWIMATNMVSISENGYKRIELRVEKFRAEIRSIVHKDELPATRVYQFGVYTLPLSR